MINSLAKHKALFLVGVGILITGFLFAQSTLSGKVVDENGKPLYAVEVLVEGTDNKTQTNENGNYTIFDLAPSSYKVTFFQSGRKKTTKPVKIENTPVTLNLKLSKWEHSLTEVEITAKKNNDFGITRLNSVEGTAIYASKKNEVLVMDDIQANKAANNSRQIFGKVSGLNIWESDGAGLQLGIGGRGLSPNRTSNFNTRQNGYDMSADALGYPESYYSPPSEALDRIEVVRGAAGLQYGTQFGGMVNFVLKKGAKNKKAEIVSRQTLGSFGFLSTFNSVGGTVGKLNHYTFYQYKQGNGWRDNSSFSAHTAHTSLYYNFHPKLRVGMEYTYMNYVAQQAGGLTDFLFQDNPRQSIRDRNWFHVNWNLAALVFDYAFSPNTQLNSRFFGLYSERNALGYLGLITRVDPLGQRDLINGTFRNAGNETRLIHRYKTLGNTSAFLVGTRYYQGQTRNRQGLGNDGYGADFEFTSTDSLEGSDYLYPSQNLSIFAENMFTLSPKFTVTPGVRLEHIHTISEGYYKNQNYHPLTGELLLEQTITSTEMRKRSFPIFGIGTSYKISDAMETYANFSQNYRAINFNDLRISNPNLIVDENIADETGYNADIGIRGNLLNKLNFDVTGFYLYYNNRIGTYWTSIENESGLKQAILKRSNIAASRNLGIEAFAELDFLRLFMGDSLKTGLSVFVNGSFIQAKYIASDESAFQDKKVELVPDTTFKTGLSFRHEKLVFSTQFSYTSSQFTDATNATFTSNAVNGTVPAYSVIDINLSYTYKFLKLETGINNLLDAKYFTRRASGYPGPGIIPSDGRNFFVTLQVKI